MTIVLFPDVVSTLLALLADELGVDTGTRVPSPRPERFILARRVGGERINPVLENVQVLVQAWAGTPSEADDLAALARAFLFKIAAPGAWSATSVDGITFLRLYDVQGPADEPDVLSDQPVDSFTLQVTARGFIQEESD